MRYNEENQFYIKTSNGEEIIKETDTILIRFPLERSVLSTSWINGGYREDISAVIINHPPRRTFTNPDLKRIMVETYLATVSGRLGLDSAKTSGLLTGAKIEKAAIVTDYVCGVEITVIVTSGFGKYDTEDDRKESLMEFFSDTINIVLIIGTGLPAHDMVRYVTIAAEAKSIVFQDLRAEGRLDNRKTSEYSTDGIVIIAQKNQEKALKDLKISVDVEDLVKKITINATRTILDEIYPRVMISDQDILGRLSKYSISDEDIWEKSLPLGSECEKDLFMNTLHEIAKQPSLLAAVTAVIHIIDENNQGLIPSDAGKVAARKILRIMPEICGLMPDQEYLFLLRSDEPIESHLQKIIAWIAIKKALA